LISAQNGDSTLLYNFGLAIPFGEVVDKFNQALQVYDDHCGQKYIMTLNHDMKKVETFKEGEKWLQMI
jgi:hypothetical protein